MPPASSPVIRLHGERQGATLDPSGPRPDRMIRAARGARRFARCAPRPNGALPRWAPKTRSCNQWPMPAPPNGIGRIPPGSSSNSCCCRIFRATRSSTPVSATCSIPTMWPSAPPCAPVRGLLTRPDCAASSPSGRSRAGGRPLAGERRRGGAAGGAAHPGDRPASRAAASGNDPHRYSSRPGPEPDRRPPIGMRYWPEPPPVAATGFAPGCRAASGASAGPARLSLLTTNCPAHDVLLPPVAHRPRPGEECQWLEFMADGGYGDAEPVALGWLGGGRGRRLAGRPCLAPARGAWFAARRSRASRRYDQECGGPPCQLRRGRCICALGRRGPADRSAREVRRRRRSLEDAFGTVWQWTRSAYSPLSGLSGGGRGRWASTTASS